MPSTTLPVLIVDDDEPTRNLLRALLRRSGYTTELATNGHEAIERLQTSAYAAVVLDIMMPQVGGVAVVEFLRTTGAPAPVIVCSAAGPGALTGLDPSVVKAIVRKPFDVDEFVAIMARVTEAS